MSRRVGDLNGLIRETTLAVISSNDLRKMTANDMYTEFFDAFDGIFDAENAVLEKGKKMTHPKGLPNYTIGMFLLASEKVKILNFYNRIVPCVRQVGVADYGIYKPIIREDDDKYLRPLVRELKTTLKPVEYEDVKQVIVDEAWKFGEGLSMTEDPALVPCNNGVYNVYTKEFIDWDESDRRGQVFINKLAVDYNPQAQDRPWHDNVNDRDITLMDMLSDICGGDADRLSALLAGMHMMIRKNWEPELCLALVDTEMTGGNGKTTISQILVSLIGNRNQCSIPIEDMSKQFLLEPLLDKTAIINPDAKDCAYVEDSSMFKSLASTDTTTVTVKFKSPVTGFTFMGHIFQATHGYLKFKDSSMAIDRRFYFIDCKTHFTGAQSTIRENKEIKSDMLKQKERLEFLLYTLLELGYENIPRFEFQKQLMKDFRNETNPVDEFLNYITDEENREDGEHWDDFYPTAWLYPAFCGFYFKTYQKKTTIRSKSFMTSLKLWAKRNEEDGWEVPTYVQSNGKEKLLKVSPRNRMDGPEMFTMEFDQMGAQNKDSLAEFMNAQAMSSNDMSKRYICNPLKKQYTCLQRVKSSQTNGTDDED